MQIDITGHHLNITDALRDRIHDRLARLNNHRATPISHIHVVLNVEKKRHICDLRTRLDSEEFVASSDDGDMYTAIDRAVDKMERQLQSSKGRKKSRRGD